MLKKAFFCVMMMLILILAGCTQAITDNTGVSRNAAGADLPGEESGIAWDTWPMFRHDAMHTGYVKARAPSTPTLLWTVNVGLPMTSSPAIANRMVFVGARDVLLAFDERTGHTLWKAPLAGEIHSSPAVDPLAGKQGLVYAASRGSRSSMLAAFDMLTGSRVWWTWMMTRSSPTVVVNPPIDIYPPVPRATLFIGAGNMLNAYDADTGKLSWSFEAYGTIDSTPAVDERYVYFGTNNNIIYALHRFTGRGIWKFEAKGPVISSPAAGEKYLVAASEEGIVYCLDKITGALSWVLETGGRIVSSPAYYGEYIYIGSGMQLLKIHEGGKLVWSAGALGEACSSPALSSGRVYIGSSKTKGSSILCFDDVTGARTWSQWMQVEASPSIAYWSMIVPTLEGYLYCFNDLE